MLEAVPMNLSPSLDGLIMLELSEEVISVVKYFYNM